MSDTSDTPERTVAPRPRFGLRAGLAAAFLLLPVVGVAVDRDGEALEPLAETMPAPPVTRPSVTVVDGTPEATIIVAKAATPDFGVLFSFGGDVAGQIGHGERMVAEVPAGEYRVTEVMPPGWRIEAIVCDDASSSGDVAELSAVYRLSPGQTVSCTFTNVRPLVFGDGFRRGDPSVWSQQPASCQHDPCLTGEALDAGCNGCVDAICAQDPFCCTGSWDGLCTQAVSTVCGLECPIADCPHDICEVGTALVPQCAPCAASICAVDPSCCDVSWDSACQAQVGSVCGIACP